nr:nucleotidyl transferase AbiEii/AbiGii toxin family protein [uncultured Cohaesibacter sp.]
MSETTLEIDIPAWVNKAEGDPVTLLQRQATEVILTAIAMTSPLNEKLVLKGGLLMGLAYDSPRQTSDIDLSAALLPEDGIGEKICAMLDEAYPMSAAELGYVDLIIKTHSVKPHPNKTIFGTANCPAIEMKVGFAEKDSNEHKAIEKKRPPNSIIKIDISFNEQLHQTQILELTDGPKLLAYGLSEIIAEKYRAMLQQVKRNRYRRQDVYDLNILIQHDAIDKDMKAQILEAFLDKARSRDLDPDKHSLQSEEVKQRSASEWHTMALEIGDLPDFEETFATVVSFYESLPWE